MPEILRAIAAGGDMIAEPFRRLDERDVSMTATGELDRKSLFNANQQEVQIRPSSAEQISFNEIVIPSIYKKSLSFVKIKF